MGAQHVFIELNDEPELTCSNKKGSYEIIPNDNSQGLTPKEGFMQIVAVLLESGPNIEIRSLG